MHLNMLRGAIHSFGGSVEVVEVAGGVCKIKYSVSREGGMAWALELLLCEVLWCPAVL
jgi:hypothetical protein